jgi:hypothetical protein
MDNDDDDLFREFVFALGAMALCLILGAALAALFLWLF